MELSSKHHLNAKQDDVWWVLTHPLLLTTEFPGLTKFEEESPGRFLGEVKVGIAFFKLTFSGTLVIADQDPPNSYLVAITGSGPGGSLDGSGAVKLSSVNDSETLAEVDGVAEVKGLIGKAGDKAIRTAALKVLEQFFKEVEAHALRRTAENES